MKRKSSIPIFVLAPVAILPLWWPTFHGEVFDGQHAPDTLKGGGETSLSRAYADDPSRIYCLDRLPALPFDSNTPEGCRWIRLRDVGPKRAGLDHPTQNSGLDGTTAWTLTLSMQLDPQARLDGAEEIVVIRVPELLEVRVSRAGNWIFELGRAGKRKRVIKGAATGGAWHEVTIVWDPNVLGSVRMIADNEVVAMKLDGLVNRESSSAAIEVATGEGSPEFKNAVLVARAVSTYEIFRRTGQSLDEWDIRNLAPVLGEQTAPVLEGSALGPSPVTDHLDLGSNGAIQRAPAQWRQLDLDPWNKPVARTTHVTLSLGDGRILLFGSEAKDTHAYIMRNTNDVWILDLVKGAWKQIAVGRQGPEPRCHQTGAFDPSTGTFFYPGGFRNDCDPNRRYGDVWTLDLEQELWEDVSLAEFKDKQFMDSIVFYRSSDGRFYFSAAGFLLSYDPKNGRYGRPRPLRFFDAAGEPLQGVTLGTSPSTVYDPERDQAVVIGAGTRTKDALGPWVEGADPTWFFTNRTWILNPETASLRLVESEQCFSPRVRGGTGRDARSGRILLYGGVRDQYSERFGDLWAFDPENEEWTEVRQSNAPGPRGGFYGMPFDPKTERFVLTHGRSGIKRFLDDTWLLDYAPESPAHGRWLFDRAAFPDQDRLVLKGTAAMDGNAEIGIRVGATKASLRNLALDQGNTFEAEDRFVEIDLRILPTPEDWGLLRIEFDSGGAELTESDWALEGQALKDF